MRLPSMKTPATDGLGREATGEDSASPVRKVPSAMEGPRRPAKPATGLDKKSKPPAQRTPTPSASARPDTSRLTAEIHATL
eukprot:540243-Rhodomonas_salina.2